MIGARHLRIWFDKIDGFTTVYDGSRYLVLFVGEKNDSIYNGVRYPIGVEYLIILIKTVFNKDKNNYYYNIFLEKGTNHLIKNNDNN